jgi:hypothetical protein
MAEKEDLFWSGPIKNNLEDLTQSIQITDNFKVLFPDDVLIQEDWEEIEVRNHTMVKKVTQMLDTLSKRNSEKGPPLFAYALWKSGQIRAAQMVDPRELFKPKVIVCYCGSELEATAMVSALSKFTKNVAATRIPKTCTVPNRDVSYCTVNADIRDGKYSFIRHKLMVVYAEDAERRTVRECSWDIKKSFRPQFMIHIGSAVSKDPELPVGTLIVPQTAGGIRLPQHLLQPESVRTFCKHKDIPQLVLESLLEEWGHITSYSTLLSDCVANPRPPEMSKIDPQMLFAAEKASLGKMTLVTGKNQSVESLAFTPNATLKEVAGKVCGARVPDEPEVHNTPLVTPKQQGKVFPKGEGTFGIIDEWSRIFGRDHKHIICVHSVSSMFPGLDDYDTERVTLEMAALVALNVLLSVIEIHTATNLSLWEEDLKKNRLQ